VCELPTGSEGGVAKKFYDELGAAARRDRGASGGRLPSHGNVDEILLQLLRLRPRHFRFIAGFHLQDFPSINLCPIHFLLSFLFTNSVDPGPVFALNRATVWAYGEIAEH
jgi:hypothetical protein